MTFFSTHSKRSTLAKASLAAMLLSFAAIQNAFAVGTAANTDITNSATVNFTVGGVSQSAVTSNVTTFKVDQKVDMTVDNNGGAFTSTTPGLANVGVIYRVTNTGNGVDNFTLTATNQTGDNFDVTNLRVYRDSTTTGPLAGVFDASDTLVSGPVAFNADQTIVFFIVADIPVSALNGQNSIVQLRATTGLAQSAGADTAGLEVVWADNGRDGFQVANNQYNIVTATLTVAKTATVLADPVNCPTGVGSCGTNLPKAIPGATIQYSITVTNTGSVAASAVVLTDNLTGVPGTTYVPGSMTLSGVGALTDTADADAGTFAGSIVTVNVGALASSGNATATFRVLVN